MPLHVSAMPRRIFFTVLVIMLACTPLGAVGSGGTAFGLPAWVVLALAGCLLFPLAMAVTIQQFWDALASPDDDEKEEG